MLKRAPSWAVINRKYTLGLGEPMDAGEHELFRWTVPIHVIDPVSRRTVWPNWVCVGHRDLTTATIDALLHINKLLNTDIINARKEQRGNPT